MSVMNMHIVHRNSILKRERICLMFMMLVGAGIAQWYSAGLLDG
jgi:hypothetical protein